MIDFPSDRELVAHSPNPKLTVAEVQPVQIRTARAQGQRTAVLRRRGVMLASISPISVSRRPERRHDFEDPQNLPASLN
jgi:hypothetical protein